MANSRLITMNNSKNQQDKADTPVVLGIGVGIAIGVALGVALSNMALGIGCGVAIGAGIATTQRKKNSNSKPDE